MKVGSYVHARYGNYLKSGISVYGDNSPDFLSVFNQQKKDLLSIAASNRNKAAVTSYLENQLNFFYGTGELTLGYSESDIQKIQAKIIEIAQNAINLATVNIDWGDLSGQSMKIRDSSGIKNIKRNKIGGINKKGEQKGYTTYQAIANRIQKINNYMEDLQAGNSTQLSHFETRIKQLQNEYEEIVKEINKEIKGAEWTSVSKKHFKFDTASKLNYAQELQKLVDDMKTAVTDTHIQGQLGEYIPVITQAVLDTVAADSVQDISTALDGINMNLMIDIIKGKVVGGERSKKTVLTNKVISKKSELGGGVQQATIGDLGCRINYTQDKVDIILDIPEQEKIKASVKNLNSFANKVHILKGKSSLIFLQDYPVFANHYLNVMAEHNNPGETAQPSASDIQKAHDTMKMTIALHALTGGVWGSNKDGSASKSDSAEILIMNTNYGGTGQKGNFKVYFMDDILSTVFNNLSLLEIKDFTSESYKNDWVGQTSPTLEHDMKKAFSRSAGILAALHQQNLEVSISKSIFI